MNSSSPHAPVLLRQVIESLSPRDSGIYVDATFGAGGYSRAMLESARCTVYGIDRDPDAVAMGRRLAAGYPGRLHMIFGRMGDMAQMLADAGVGRVDGVAMDLGVSSMQIDRPERGFSFRFDGPLDMRMGDRGPTAADLVNSLPEEELADIIWRFGEERASRRIARSIVERRKEQAIESTSRLAEIVRGCLKKSKDGIDPATRTFQALRIRVNDELGELDRGLLAAERLLAPGGRLAVVSFHSLEDRRVKEFLKNRSGHTSRPSRHLPDLGQGPAPSFRLLSSKAIQPDAEEIGVNPRSRSARLRAAERTEAPPWDIDERVAA